MAFFRLQPQEFRFFQKSATKVLFFWGTVLDDSQQADGFKHTAVGCGFVVKGERVGA